MMSRNFCYKCEHTGWSVVQGGELVMCSCAKMAAPRTAKKKLKKKAKRKVVKTCEWKLWDSGKGWSTSCDLNPTKRDHPVAHSLYAKCPFCGGKIKEAPNGTQGR